MPSDDRAEEFLRLSELLTGFGRVDLLGTGQADCYLRTVRDALPPAVLDELLAAADGPEILADPKLGPVARDVILLWYRGTWQDHVVSAAAYQAGLEWVAAGAHPVAAREQGFGAWGVRP
jgi:hypothetical protein